MAALPARYPAGGEDPCTELRTGMAGHGLTGLKLLDMPGVLTLPAVRDAVAAAPPGAAAVAAYDAVAAAARRLGDGVHARLLRASLAIDYAGRGKDLTARRNEFVAGHNAAVLERRDVLPATPRAIYAIENEMLRELVARLGGDAAIGGDGAAPTPLRTLPGHDWHTVELDATCRFVGQAIRVTEVVEVIEATRDGLDLFVRNFYCATQGGSPARLVVHEGGRVVDERPWGHSNFRSAFIELPGPVARGERRRIRFDVCYPRRRRSEPWFTVNAHRRYHRIALRLRFDTECPPERVWLVDGIPMEAQGGDPDRSPPLTPDRFGYVEATFTEPTLSLCYGIAWSF